MHYQELNDECFRKMAQLSDSLKALDEKDTPQHVTMREAIIQEDKRLTRYVLEILEEERFFMIIINALRGYDV